MRVVIAEDVAVLREGLARLLGDRGHEVCAAGRPPRRATRCGGRARPGRADRRDPDAAGTLGRGPRAAVDIRRDFPSTGVLLFSQYIETR
jgi:hypothetical protein